MITCTLLTLMPTHMIKYNDRVYKLCHPAMRLSMMVCNSIGPALRQQHEKQLSGNSCLVTVLLMLCSIHTAYVIH